VSGIGETACVSLPPGKAWLRRQIVVLSQL